MTDMTWNYRVTRTLVVSLTEGGVPDQLLEIREVYYNKDGTISAWSESAVSPSGGSIEDLSWDLDMMNQAMKQPILNVHELEAAAAKKLEELQGAEAPPEEHHYLDTHEVYPGLTWQTSCSCGYQGRKAMSQQAAMKPALEHKKSKEKP